MTTSQTKVSTIKTEALDRPSDAPAPSKGDSFDWSGKTWMVDELDDNSNLARASSGGDSQRFSYEVIAQAKAESETTAELQEEQQKAAKEQQGQRVEASKAAEKEAQKSS